MQVTLYFLLFVVIYHFGGTKLKRKDFEERLAEKDALIRAQDKWEEVQMKAFVIVVSVVTSGLLFKLDPLSRFLGSTKESLLVPYTYSALTAMAMYLAYKFHGWIGNLVKNSYIPKKVLADRPIPTIADLMNQKRIGKVAVETGVQVLLPAQAQVATANPVQMESAGNA